MGIDNKLVEKLKYKKHKTELQIKVLNVAENLEVTICDFKSKSEKTSAICYLHLNLLSHRSIFMRWNCNLSHQRFTKLGGNG